MLIFKILILVALLKLLINTERPSLCAGIYTAIVLLFNLMFGLGFITSIVGAAISGVLALIYFWLLNHFRDTAIFWLVLILGLAIGLV
ncbi:MULTISPECIES: hypothetical protein [unclassified Pseudoalteromonas]|jgi:hypothetical protein|uniref:hypothetical protein n=1 Tax=unclassified Pseudoalteromonas TaxID=194690 RepID=UPI001881F1D1|nr:hypothetical protein [Lelliottia steviae]MCF7501851.1 hypothetical protein [Pseudoalteromonas sp. L1]WOC26137.1 hypothetical protein LY624_16485 [Pseudoalteromonas sp. N1230-9]